jgi:hypothetical protein
MPPFHDLKYLAQRSGFTARDGSICQIHVTTANPDWFASAGGAASALRGISIRSAIVFWT